MLIGILSDSHDQLRAMRQAMKLFDELGTDHIIHCGDIGGEHIFDELVGRPCSFVWGNCDVPSGRLIAYLQAVELTPPAEIPTLLTLDARRFAVFHGHEQGFNRAVEALDVDYLLHGHTHIACDTRLNGKRIINPGALHRARPKTVATLDTATDALTFHEIPSGSGS